MNIKKYIFFLRNNIIYEATTLIIAICTVIIMFLNISKNPLDIDELFTLNMLYTNNLYEIILYGNILDDHPPLYHLLMYLFTKCFGLSEYIIRIPSILFFGATIYLSFILTKKLFSPICGLITSITTIILIPDLEIVLCARGYSLLLLLSVLTMVNLTDIIDFKIYKKEKELPANILIYFIISSLLCMYTHYYGCILVFCEILFLILLFGKKIIKQLIIICASLILLFGPWLLISYPNPERAPRTRPDFIEWLDWNVMHNYNIYILYILVFIIIIEIIYYLYSIKKHKINKPYAFLLILYLFIFPFLLTSFIHNFIINCYQHKYLIISLIPFYTLIAYSICNIFKNKICLYTAIFILCLFHLKYTTSYLYTTNYLFFDNSTYYLNFVISNINKQNRYTIIIDKWDMFKHYYKYHFDKYLKDKTKILVLKDFDEHNPEIIKTINDFVVKNDNKLIWLFDSTSITDIKLISDNKEVITLNKGLPSIYLVK